MLDLGTIIAVNSDPYPSLHLDRVTASHTHKTTHREKALNRRAALLAAATGSQRPETIHIAKRAILETLNPEVRVR